MNRTVLSSLKGLLVASAALAICAAHAQTYPTKPLSLVVGFAPGGSADSLARLLAQKLGSSLGQPVIVDNKAGANGAIASEYVMRAAPDGYTLMLGYIATHAMNPALQKLRYDPVKDFEPVGMVGSSATVMVLNPDVRAGNAKEVVAMLKAAPDKTSYASAGNGSGQHVLAAALWHLAGVNVVHVPYRGAQAAYQDLLGGRVDVFFDLSSTARVQVDAGNVKALAVSGAERNPMHPDVPTINETGVAQLDLESWFGYFAPAKTPPDILERLRTDLARVMAMPDLQETFRKAGGKPMSLSMADTHALVKRDVERWSKLVRTIGIKAE